MGMKDLLFSLKKKHEDGENSYNMMLISFSVYFVLIQRDSVGMVVVTFKRNLFL